MTQAEAIIPTQAQEAPANAAPHVHGFENNIPGWALVSMISIMAGQWSNSENRVTASAELSTAYNKLVTNLSNEKEAQTKDWMTQIIDVEKTMNPNNKNDFSEKQAEVQVLNQEMNNSKTFFGSEMGIEQSTSTTATNNFSNDMSNLTSIFDAMKDVSTKTTSLLTTLLNVVKKGRI